MKKPYKKTADRIEGLDLLRGFAIFLVMLRHAIPNILGGGGIVGVVVFFTLSGYLITGILVKDIRNFGAVRYGRFYRNRILRLVPALLFMLVGIIVMTLVFNPLKDSSQLLRTLIVAITYTGNFPFDHGSNSTGHLWTLATEEQFYLIWPIILVLGIYSKRLKIAVFSAGSVILLACAGSLIFVAPDFKKIYILPSSWAIAMVIGAIANLGRTKIGWLFTKKFTFFSYISLVVLIGLSFFPNLKESPLAYILIGPCIAFFSTILIYYLLEWNKLPFVFLRPLLWLGIISYAAYLWNYPITLWLNTTENLYKGVLSIIFTIGAASVSWVLIERPFALLKKRLDGIKSNALAIIKIGSEV